jgi:hypothetical protein
MKTCRNKCTKYNFFKKWSSDLSGCLLVEWPPYCLYRALKKKMGIISVFVWSNIPTVYYLSTVVLCVHWINANMSNGWIITNEELSFVEYEKFKSWSLKNLERGHLVDKELYDDDDDEFHRNRVRWCSCSSVNFCLVDTRFKYRPEHRLS